MSTILLETPLVATQGCVNSTAHKSTQVTLKDEKRRQKKDADSRSRILSIALKSFANRGFDGVSTTDIAKAAGVTQPLIHYHFKSKKALWKTIVRNSFAVLNEEYIQPIHRAEGLSNTQRAEKAIEDFVSFVAVKSEFAQILMSESTQQTTRLHWLIEELLEPVIHDLRNAYLEGVKHGVLVDMPIAQLFSLVLGAASQFYVMDALNMKLFNVDVMNPAHSEAHIATVVEMLKKVLIVDLPTTP